MFKRILVYVAIALISIMPLGNVYASASGIAVLINGSDVVFTESSGSPFIDKNSCTQVPLRVTMEAYGCDVSWSPEQKVAVVKKDGKTVSVPIGMKYILVDSKQILTDTTAVIKDDRTYLPIRALLEAFGASVSWDGQNVIITNTTGAVEMTVHFIDVGQADSIFIDKGTYEILVDAGNNWDGEKVVAYIRPFVDGNLELAIGTHSDADHIGGMDDVIKAFQVDKIIYSGESGKNTKTYQDFLDAAKSEPNCELIEDSDMLIDMGDGASISIIETGDGYADSNDNSVVARLQYGNVSLLLTGDMEAAAEKKSLGKFSKVDVLKAGHHGSKTSCGTDFLNITRPSYVIISAGLNNKYRHPHAEALHRYEAIGATVYGTFKSGTIRMVTDGSKYSFDTDKKITLQDAGDI